MPLIIIACGARKLDVAAPASKLYTGPYFRACLRFARQLAPDPDIRILSARYGLVRLEEVLDPYDQRLRPDAVASLAFWVQAHNTEAVANEAQVLALCGSPYNRVVRRVWPHAQFPLLDAQVGGIGKQLAWFKRTDAKEIRRKYLELPQEPTL